MIPQFMKNWELPEWSEVLVIITSLAIFSLIGFGIGWGWATKQVGSAYKQINNEYQQDLGREASLEEGISAYLQTCSYDYSDSCKTINTWIKDSDEYKEKHK